MRGDLDHRDQPRALRQTRWVNLAPVEVVIAAADRIAAPARRIRHFRHAERGQRDRCALPAAIAQHRGRGGLGIADADHGAGHRLAVERKALRPRPVDQRMGGQQRPCRLLRRH